MDRSTSLDSKIATAEKSLARYKCKYEMAVKKLAALREQKMNMEKKAIFEAYERSPRSFHEVIMFLRGTPAVEDID